MGLNPHKYNRPEQLKRKNSLTSLARRQLSDQSEKKIMSAFSGFNSWMSVDCYKLEVRSDKLINHNNSFHIRLWLVNLLLLAFDLWLMTYCRKPLTRASRDHPESELRARDAPKLGRLIRSRSPVLDSWRRSVTRRESIELRNASTKRTSSYYARH